MVESDKIQSIPEQFSSTVRTRSSSGASTAPDGVKIHIEDFARILGAVDQQKYFLANQENLVNVTTQFSSDPFGEAFEAIRRFVVDIMVGNGDGHLKSWSFIFPDGNRDRILTFQLFMREREMLLAPSSGQPAAAETSLVPESQH